MQASGRTASVSVNEDYNLMAETDTIFTHGEVTEAL